MLHSELGHIEQHYLPHFLASFVEMLFGLYLTEITLALFSTQLPGHGSTFSCICGCYSAIFGCYMLFFDQFSTMLGVIWPFSKINFQPNLEAYCCVMFIFVRHVMRLLFAFAFSVFLSFGLLWLVFVALIQHFLMPLLLYFQFVIYCCTQ